MIRRSWMLRASQCLYESLGVPPTASADEIKVAFRDRAKKTHPDMAGSPDATRRFRLMVEAYRVLRDPKKRAEYDREVAAKAAAGRQPQWPPGDMPHGQGSAAFRANLYNYPHGGAAEGPVQGDAQYNPAGIRTEWAAVGMVSLAGIWFFLPSDRSNYHDPDPYPSRRPGTKLSTTSPRSSTKSSSAVETLAAPAAVGSLASPADGSPASPTKKTSASPPAESLAPDPVTAESRLVGDVLVSSFYNPFSAQWQRIPEGYEAPAAMDLTSWHKKRTDPVEWARLFAEGKLSEIIPRGGLQVRFRPAWDTHEPAIVRDPWTGKTVHMSDKLPPRNISQKCEVQF